MHLKGYGSLHKAFQVTSGSYFTLKYLLPFMRMLRDFQRTNEDEELKIQPREETLHYLILNKDILFSYRN